MSRTETTDLSFVADRVHPEIWALFQTIRTRMRQMRGVSMEIRYEKHSREPTPAFLYEKRQLFNLHARGEEINATFHADQRVRTRVVQDETIDWRLRDQVNKRTWTAFTLRCSRDLPPFMELVKAKYDLINQEVLGKTPEERPVAL